MPVLQSKWDLPVPGLFFWYVQQISRSVAYTIMVCNNLYQVQLYMPWLTCLLVCWFVGLLHYYLVIHRNLFSDLI
jgi:hypothetical protein